jgi:hypothetical protein
VAVNQRLGRPTADNLANVSFQIRAHNLDQIVGGFLGSFVPARHVISNVILHELAHQAIDCSTRGGESLKNIGALIIVSQTAKDTLELPDDLLCSIDQIQFFAR